MIRVSDFEDIQLRCVDCGQAFTWTAGEQAFFASKHFQQPKRCPDCRKWRRAGLVIDDTSSPGGNHDNG